MINMSEFCMWFYKKRYTRRYGWVALPLACVSNSPRPRPMTGADCPGTGSRPKTGSLSSRDGLRPKAASLVLVQLPALGPHSLVSGQTRLGACLPLVLVRAGTSTSQTRPRTDG